MKEKNLSIQTLRLIGLILISLYHLNPSLCSGGFLFVILFFVLSGYFFAKHPKKIFQRLGKMAKPLVWLTAICLALVTIFFKDMAANTRMEAIFSSVFANNIYQIQNKASYWERWLNPSFFTHLWYISLDMQFCLAWWCLYLVIQKTKTFFQEKVALLLFLSAFAYSLFFIWTGGSSSYFYYSFLTRIAPFLGGVWLSYVHRSTNFKSASWGWLALIGMVFLAFVSVDSQLFTYQVVMPIFILLSLWLVDFSHKHPKWGLSLPFLDASFYPLYLCQYSSMVFIQSLLAHQKVSNLEILKWQLVAWLGSSLLLMILSKIPFSLIFAILGLGFSVHFLPQMEIAQKPPVKTVLIARSPLINHVSKLDKPRKKEKEVVSEGESTIPPTKEVEAAYYGVSFIGDSVLGMVQDDLTAYFPSANFNTKVGRQAYEYPAIIQSMTLGDIVVVSIGNNGNMSQDHLNQILNLVGSRPLVLLTVVVPKPWEEPNNKLLKEFARQHADQVSLVDWYDLAKEKSEYFYPDFVHPNPTGAQIFAQILADKIHDLASIHGLVPDQDLASDTELNP